MGSSQISEGVPLGCTAGIGETRPADQADDVVDVLAEPDLRRHVPVDEPSPGAGFRAGFLINVTNPKAGIFAISFLPQFVPAHAAGPLPLLLLVLVWMLTDTVWYTALALALTRVGRWLRTATVRRRLEKTSGGLFVAFGVAMAVES
ncbi:LysE family translocator [Amycolatopsis granulosa]|uniref:LysE family translocator n=1 Tax=Amycolatopsis granulosa TaxID=185684 RepID=UPI00312C86C4|nr:threonine/homoserine/homoserine lactone efflux protein [Amycolatopsis granulosa]